MKAIEKKQAIELRLKGGSIKEIAKALGVAKSSVSLWVRDVELTEEHKEYLRKKGLFREKIERGRKTRLFNEQVKRNLIIDPARKSIGKIGREELLLIGVMLYWAEGGKTQRLARFSNSDPRLIKIMMMFFRIICSAPEEKFRAHIHIHHHLDHKEAEKYWSLVTGIPLSQFYRSYRKPPKSSQGKKDSLPCGTLQVYVLDVNVFYMIQGWTLGIFDRLIEP